MNRRALLRFIGLAPAVVAVRPALAAVAVDCAVVADGAITTNMLVAGLVTAARLPREGCQ